MRAGARQVARSRARSRAVSSSIVRCRSAILERRARIDAEFRAFLTGAVDGGRYERRLDACSTSGGGSSSDGRQPSSRGHRFDLFAGVDPDDAAADRHDRPRCRRRSRRPLPTSLVDALDTARSGDLVDVLDGLVADLDGSPGRRRGRCPRAAPRRWPVASSSWVRPSTTTSDRLGSRRQSQHSTEDLEAVARRRRIRCHVHSPPIVFPIVAVTAGLVAHAVAWIG